MTASKDFSTIVRVQIGQAPDSVLLLTSSDLPELFLAGKDLRELLKDVPLAIKLIYKHNYEMDVTVVPAREGGPVEQEREGFLPSHFVAMPVAAQFS